MNFALEILDVLQQIAGQLVATSLKQSTATINNLLKNNSEAIGDGAQSLNQLAPAIRELRETLNALKGISRQLEADPSGYLLGRDNNQEFQP